LLAQSGVAPVTLKVEIVNPQPRKSRLRPRRPSELENVVIWLTPIRAGRGSRASDPPMPAHPPRKSRRSIRVSILTSWSFRRERQVQFPNKDPFLHNVFSLFDGKRFDLGFYEAGSSKTVNFDRAGVSFLFCNIHPEMSGAVIVGGHSLLRHCPIEWAA
jgi:hypothetical protein